MSIDIAATLAGTAEAAYPDTGVTTVVKSTLNRLSADANADCDDLVIASFLGSLTVEEPALVKSIHARPLEVATHQAASHAPEASQQLALEAAMPTFSQGCPVIAAIRLRHSSPHVDAPSPNVPFVRPKYQFDPALAQELRDKFLFGKGVNFPLRISSLKCKFR
ncbi:hypothetical protein GOP47_0006748 [Adiantum capillus-veneris]|uniref:Uncharacterized protein n=1 Tax=Adiantum capillus-veneris TaxID=13818 RepID=A0A9D4V507_ADICA|nr:hypothetical protein GOP47_0006748 [Adiantum capillus-veneris]